MKRHAYIPASWIAYISDIEEKTFLSNLKAIAELNEALGDENALRVAAAGKRAGPRKNSPGYVMAISVKRNIFK